MLKIKNKEKRILRRIIALTTVTALSLGIIPMPEIAEEIREHLFQGFTLNANAVSYITISNYTQLLSYAQSYSSSNKNDEITIQCNEKLSIPYDFPGIGTSDAPFEGKVVIMNVSSDNGGDSRYLQLQAPLFNYISDKASIVNASNQPCSLYLYPDALSSGTFDKPLFANYVAGTGGTANWKIKVNDTDLSANNNQGAVQINARSALIGELYSKTSAPDITLEYFNQNAAINGTGDLGVICNKISAGSLAVTLTNGLETGNITTTIGNVGGLVGTMAAGSSFTLNTSISYANKRTIQTSSGYAGGIVGKCEGVFNIGSYTYNDSMYSDIIGTTGAGGLFGYFSATSNVSIPLNKYTVTSRPGDSVDPGQGIKSDDGSGKTGGLIGELENKGSAAVITLSGNSGDNNSATPSVDVSLRGKYGGGLVGYYKASTLADSLIIQNINCKSEGSMAVEYGGIVGRAESVSDCGAYIYVSDIKTTVSAFPANTNINYKRINTTSAGIICYFKNSFLDCKNEIKVLTTAETGKINTGLVYKSENGVIRLAGITDLSGVAVDSDILKSILVNERGNTLIYALGSGTDNNWKYIRPDADDKYIDDIKTWGQVVRLVSTTSGGANNTDLETAGVVTVNSSAHTVTLAPDSSSAITTTADFAKIALNIKLNTTGNNFGALCFDSGSHQMNTLVTSTISLGADINLSGTGLTGFTRDDDTTYAFTGTFNGENHSVTLAIGEAYGYKGSDSSPAANANTLDDSGVKSNGMTGAINSHLRNGLFSKLGNNCTINSDNKSLTLTGNIYAFANSDIYIGGLAAIVTGKTVNINNVTAHENTYTYGGKYIGALIGDVPGSNPETLNIKECSFTGSLNIWSNGANIGLVGRIDDSAIDVTFESVDLEGTINYKGTERPYSGGLVGGMSSNDAYTRNVYLNDIDINGLTVSTNTTDSNKAGVGNPAGGLLGGRWENANVFFGDSTHSVIVTSGTVSLSGCEKYAGGLVADATGYWQVNDIRITSMTVSGATDALGLLVMNGKSGNNGLYLEITSPTAYSITPTSVTTDTVTVYDEIMAFSKGVETETENNVTSQYPSEANGQAIISIHTTGDVLSSGNSYSPTTTKGSQYNPYSRYYYNLDYLLKKESPTAGEKLLLWSVYKYATANISANTKMKSENTKNFSDYSSLPASGSVCDMNNLSYYPVDISSATTVNRLTVKLYNSEMQTAHGSIYNLNSLQSSNYSQHFLMHAALFKNVTKSLTINNMTLQGNVSAHEGTHYLSAGSGAIVCGEIKGSNPNSKAQLSVSGLSLDGIKVNGTSGINALIVKKIGDNTNISLSNVSTTAQYVTDGTTTAAKYLMGEASGGAMTILFDKMILDGRISSGTVPALTSIYHTNQSIFSEATFLKSLQYSTGVGSSAKYDYKWEEDWDGSPLHQVTYASEISETAENVENGVSQQSKYVDRYTVNNNEVYTSPESNVAASPYTFTAFRPHVATAYNAANNYHEVAVNIVSYNLDDGCGTYNDPYIVDGNQLKVIADALNDTGSTSGFSSGFSLYIDEDYYSYSSNTVNTNINFEKFCTSKTGHAQFVYNGTDFESEDWAYNLSVQQVKNYLAGAYYYIESDTSLPSGYVGLGGNSIENAFRGVIVSAEGVKITNPSAFPLVSISNGCVVKNLTINVTNNSITKSASSNGSFSYGSTTAPEYYGGVIGEIMGGDNIIDNVKVTYSASITVDGTYKQLVPVGGYIGVVVNGSVFFRNMTGINASNTSVTTGEGEGAVTDTGMNFHVTDGTNSGYENEVSINAAGTEIFKSLYVNPIVGRVINGFAVNESDAYRYSEDGYYVDKDTAGRTTQRAASAQQTTLKNNRKNFSIPDFNPTSKLSVNSTDITANDAQALYILSLICQTNMGSAKDRRTNVDNGNYQASVDSGYDSVSSGKQLFRATHLANYDGVGILNTNNSSPGSEPVQAEGESASDYAVRLAEWNAQVDFNKTKKELANSAKEVPYLIYKYTDGTDNNYYARTITYTARNLKLNSTATTYYLPDSFRGIGLINNRSISIKLISLSGYGNTIDVNLYFRAYDYSIDNYYNSNLSTKDGVMGVGLFNNLRANSDSTVVDNFILTGYVSGKRSDGSMTIITMASSSNYNDIGVAGIAPDNMNSKCTFSNIHFNNLNVDSSSKSGAFFAKITKNSIYLNNCSSDHLKVTGYGTVGGLVGCGSNSIYINTVDGASSQFNINVHQLNAGNSGCYTGGIAGELNSAKYIIAKNINIIGWNGDFRTNSTIKPFIGRKEGEAINNNTLFVGGVLGYNTDKGSQVIILDNVNIYGVNIYGYISGGFIGFDGDNAVKYSITNCGIHGKSDNNVTIDNSATYVIRGNSIAGGIVGRSYNECVGPYSGNDTFTVDDLYTYYRQFNGCCVNDYRIEETTTTQHGGWIGAGGIIGVSRNNKSLKNIKVQDCTIVCNGGASSAGMGGIIGTITKHTVNGYNIAVENVCFGINTTGVNKVPYGLFSGLAGLDNNNVVTHVKISGYTALGSNKISAAFGYDKKTYISAGERDVEFDCGRLANSADLLENKFISSNNNTYRYHTDSYIIYSDYEGASTKTDTTAASNIGYAGKTLPTVNGTDNAASVSSSDNFPYANSSPAVTVGDKIMSGDGIWYKDNNGVISLKADKILSDLTTWSSTNIAKKYSNITNTDKTNYESLKAKISTFNTQYGSDLLTNDIPVIVMDNKSEDLTDKICSYIRILTNSTEDFRTANDAVYTIQMLKCNYVNNALNVATSGASLTRAGGVISMQSPYDSASDSPQFTVIDVQFRDPANTSKIAYHLYIPVYTKKAFNFKFDITALSGTSYYRPEYTSGSHFAGLPATRNNDDTNIVVENYSSPVTMFMRYEYKTDDIIKDLLAEGYGLNWNYNKALDFIYNYSNDDALPSGTKFILIDVNQKDKANYSSGFTPAANSDLDIDSTKFPAYTVDGNNYSAFSVISFKDLLTANSITLTATALTGTDAIEAAQTAGTPIFYAETTDAQNTSQFSAPGVPSGKSLVPASSEQQAAGTGLYTVSASGSTMYEDYYLTIIAPEDSGDIRHQINVKSKVTLEHGSNIKANCEANDNVILMFANLFTKDISIATIEADNTDKEMNTNEHNSIDIQAITTISFNSSGLGDQLDEVRRALNARNVSIYHSTLLDFVKIEADNSQQSTAVSGVTFALNSAPSGSESNYRYNSGVYVKVANGTTGADIFYSDDSETTDRYKQMVSCTDANDFVGKTITNFYEVINKNNGNMIDLRPLITGQSLNDESAHEVKIVANFNMAFNSNGINDQFAVRESGSEAGTIVKGQASLAYQPNDTTYSNNTSVLQDASPVNRKFYRQPALKTELYYNTLNTESLATADAKTKTNAMLGINPFDEGTTTTSAINTWGNYDATQLPGAGTATQVKWTLSLYRREKFGNSAEYGTPLNITDYLTGIKFYGYDSVTAEKGSEISQDPSSTSTELVFKGARSAFEDVTPNRFLSYIDYNVKTGTALESASQFYSNYKVILTAELVGDTNSRASDHIIYTNARLDPAFIDKVTGGSP